MGIDRRSDGSVATVERPPTLLRITLAVDAAVFLAAALLNLGVSGPLGLTTLSFPDHVWQAGIGEAVIGGALLAAGVTARRGLAWVALWISAAGIAIGLASPRVQGAARAIHVVPVPLAIVALGLLIWSGRRAGERIGSRHERKRVS